MTLPAVRSGLRGPAGAPAQAVYVNHVIMLFRSIDRPLAGRCQAEVRSRGGDGLHLHNTVALGVPSGREATSHRGGRAPHACGPTPSLRALAFSPHQPVRRSRADGESQTPRPPSDITPPSSAAVRRSVITRTYSPNPGSPRRRLEACSTTRSEQQTGAADLYCKTNSKRQTFITSATRRPQVRPHVSNTKLRNTDDDDDDAAIMKLTTFNTSFNRGN